MCIPVVGVKCKPVVGAVLASPYNLKPITITWPNLPIIWPN